MYAVIKVGGKQERVRPGDVIEVEFMKVDPGSSVEFEPIVVFDDDGKAHVGKDLSRAKVVARLLGDKKGETVKVFKYRSKSGYRRTQGHRQMLTLLEVEEVGLSPGKKATMEDAAEAKEKTAASKPAAKAPATRTTAKKPAAKTTTTKKPTTKKTTSKKPPAKKTTAKKTAARKKS
jgi:large subunit ribosomal protein L21